MHTRTGITLVWLTVGAALAAGCDIEAESRSAEGSFERTLRVNGPVDLDILARSGRIDVRVGEGDAVRIVGRIRAYGSDFLLGGLGGAYTAEEQVKSLESSPPIEQDRNAIRVGDLRGPVFASNVSISYTVTVPADTRLRTSSRSGDQTIEAIQGPVVASSRSGRIQVGRVAGDVEIETRSGQVEVRLPSDGGARLDVETRSGAIDSEAPIVVNRRRAHRTVAATIGGGGRRLEVRTRSGSIRIR